MSCLENIWRVLVVDDEPQVLAALEDLLEDDYEVITVRTAVRALEMLAQDKVAVIISDQRMPDMCGDEFLTRAKTLSDATRILLTGYADLAAVTRAVNDGRIFAYLSKPWDPPQLRALVAKAVEHHDMSRRLADEQELLHGLMDNVSDLIWFMDIENRYVRLNRAAASTLGLADPDAAAGKTPYEFAEKSTADFHLRLNAQAMEAGRPISVPEYPLQDGSDNRWLSVSCAPITAHRPSARRTVAIARDVTARHQAEQALREREAHIRLLLDSTAEAIYGVDCEGNCTFCNPACLRMLGYGHADELTGRNMHRVCHHSWPDGHPYPEHECLVYRSFRHGEQIHVDNEVFWRADGTSFPVEYWSHPIRKNGETVGAVVTFIDLTERLRTQDRIHRLANFDALTGLPNRALFTDRLEQALVRAQRHRRGVAVLVLGLDRFKVVNETLGHQAGDRLLCTAAQRLAAAVRADDTVARFSGDEFVVLLGDLAEGDDAGLLAAKLLGGFAKPLEADGQELFLTASIGAAVYPDHGADAATLLKNAESALFRAKERGRGRYQFYSVAEQAHTPESLALENDLHRALNQKEFILHYQPQLDLDSGAITGVEALLRWQHPHLGLVPPGRFIHLLEATGLIVPVGRWVLETACRQHMAWRARGLPALRMAVNLSALQFQQDNLVDSVQAVLDDTAIPPACLELEITETTIMHRIRDAVDILERFKAMGVQLAIDDFGTGYSSLSYLAQFPVDVLKIDRSFIADLPDNAHNAEVTRIILNLARNLDLKVVAEGVESAAQAALLRDERCNRLQGYWLSRPLPAAELEPLLGRPPAATPESALLRG